MSLEVKELILQLESHCINDDGFELANRVFTNEVILRHFFNIIPLKLFKECRLVCRLWKNVSESLFKSRVRICFDFDARFERIKTMDLANSNYQVPFHLKHFFSKSQQQFAFEALRFKNVLRWSGGTLIDFFSTEGRFITSLEFHDVRLPIYDKLRSKHFYSTYDLSTLVSCMVNLKSLKIFISSMCIRSTTIFSLTSKAMSKIPFIFFSGCQIHLKGEVIAPKDLRLVNANFYQNNKRLETVLLNDIVNFTNLKKLMLVTERIEPTTKIQLNLSGSVVLDKLVLGNVDYFNSEKSLWTLEAFYLLNYTFFRAGTNLKTKLMYIEDPESVLDCVPKCVEKLVVTCKMEFPTDFPIFLPKLKSLELNRPDTLKLFLPHLLNSFSNLIELTLHSEENIQTEIIIDKSLLPKSVKRLTLLHTKFQFVGETDTNLDVMILKYSNLEFAKRAMKHFSPNNFFVFFKNANRGDWHSLAASLSGNQIVKTLIGYFCWGNAFTSIKNNILSSVSLFDEINISVPYVENSKEFYSVVNQHGCLTKCCTYAEAKSIQRK